MRISKLACLLTALFLLLGASARAQTNTFQISCEGTESAGGGVLRYQYTLVNNAPNPQMLTQFYLGTQDLNPANYWSWTAPPGFVAVATVGPWMSLPGTSVMFTSLVKTPHGVIPPAGGPATPGGVLWTGSLLVNPGQQVSFGFVNPHASNDVQWLADHPGGAINSVGAVGMPIAGPIGVFTRGWVHGPSVQELGSRYCSPNLPNSTGVSGRLIAIGSNVDAADFLDLYALSLPTNNNIGYFIMGTGTNTFIPNGAGSNICVTPGLKRYLPPVNNANQHPGGFDRPVGTQGIQHPISVHITAGSTWNFQAWHRDSAAGTSHFTDAVSITFL